MAARKRAAAAPPRIGDVRKHVDLVREIMADFPEWVFNGNRVAPGGQEHMLSDEAANAQRLIGKRHRAGERAADRHDMRVAGQARTSRNGQSRNKLARLAISPVGKSVRARITKRTSSGVDARTAADLRALIHRAKGPRLPGPRGALVSCSTAARPALIRPARQQMQKYSWVESNTFP